MVSIQTKTKQDNGIVAKKPSNYQQHQKATGNGQRKKNRKNQSIVIVNSKAKTTRPITLEGPVQKRGKEDNINSELAQEENSELQLYESCVFVLHVKIYRRNGLFTSLLINNF